AVNPGPGGAPGTPSRSSPPAPKVTGVAPGVIRLHTPWSILGEEAAHPDDTEDTLTLTVFGSNFPRESVKPGKAPDVVVALVSPDNPERAKATTKEVREDGG